MRLGSIAVVLVLATLAADCVSNQEGDAGVEASVAYQPLVDAGLAVDPQIADELNALEEFRLQMEDGSADELDMGRSAYQLRETERRIGGRKAGVLLGRMGVSEGIGLQPLKDGWKFDIQGILQVADNTRRQDESLWTALARKSPHVAKEKEYTRDRQRWTSTLQSHGNEAPDLWVECLSWESYVNKRGHTKRRGLPLGCHGVWKASKNNWVMVRNYAIKLVAMAEPPRSVPGTPTTWGGVMDIWGYLRANPAACWLKSSTRNYFFGPRGMEGNECTDVSSRLVKRSRTVSTAIMLRGMERLKQRDIARRRAQQQQ